MTFQPSAAISLLHASGLCVEAERNRREEGRTPHATHLEELDECLARAVGHRDGAVLVVGLQRHQAVGLDGRVTDHEPVLVDPRT